MKESQLENKTTIATNDYVRMVDENGNSVKIKKDSFMAAIRDALPSIISDGETGGGSVLSIINGALKTRTDANLASVLGVYHKLTTFDLDTLTTSGRYFLASENTPTGNWGFLDVDSSSEYGRTKQTFRPDGSNIIMIRTRQAFNIAWTSWNNVTTQG